MDSAVSFCLVYCPCSSVEEANSLAQELLKRSWVACANVFPAMTSHYLWEGKLETSAEALLILKTRRDWFDKIRNYLIQVHSYDVPAILSIPIKDMNSSFSHWMELRLLCEKKKSVISEDYINKTVVVDVNGSFVYLGVLIHIGEEWIQMKSVDVHDVHDSQSNKETYVRKSKQTGLRPNRDFCRVDRSKIVSISLLEDIQDF
jgi:periplasmic divalent cation tolerance protein